MKTLEPDPGLGELAGPSHMLYRKLIDNHICVMGGSFQSTSDLICKYIQKMYVVDNALTQPPPMYEAVC